MASDCDALLGQEQSAAALANLARESEGNRNCIVEANGIPPLLALLDSSNPKSKENSVNRRATHCISGSLPAALALPPSFAATDLHARQHFRHTPPLPLQVVAITELCRKSKINQVAFSGAGGIPKLVSVLLGFQAAGAKEASYINLCTLAAEAIKEMAKDNPSNQQEIAEAGAIPPLVAALGASFAHLQANAAGALANLARSHMENQGLIARTGAVAPLCTLVRDGSEETKDRCASAIWSLATDHAINKDTIAKLGGIDPLLGLLLTGTTERSQVTQHCHPIGV